MPAFLNRKLLTVALVLAVGWLGHAAYRVHAQRLAVQVQVDDLQSKVSRAEDANQFLASASAYFKSNEYLEKQARLKLNYKLSDEKVAFVYPDKGEKAASGSGDADFSLSGWRSWFKNLFK